ncbi:MULTISPECIES: divalent-cation tolerance protein CutA [unclassified Streptomyces]|uniref:divalent-cation tolerance protein CutA n=1 Tax=unclassified Streptomyces TaxID=2593676 RepID=UPI00224E3D4A|nr:MULTISPECIES: divalent-cation tolerance protein CutA [unclassified Streptomyces]MCX4834211.1 divalent-cation tolerance protein CutA [Streptomyces sp. NBC_01016]
MTNYLQVATATATQDEAVVLVKAVVSSRLAAGAQVIGPVVSAFWHNGEFGTGEEYRVLFKTRADRYSELEEFVLAHHPWERPELNAVVFAESSEDFRGWVDKNLG